MSVCYSHRTGSFTSFAPRCHRGIKDRLVIPMVNWSLSTVGLTIYRPAAGLTLAFRTGQTVHFDEEGFPIEPKVQAKL
jgi:hypothetical protein